MSVSTQTVARELIDAFMAKDKARVLALFAEDGLFYDPHYPQPAMQGKEAIAAGLDFVFQFIAKPGFTPRKVWQDGDSCVVELDTHHTFANGTEAQFPQMMVIDLKNGMIARAQVYLPFPPPQP